MEYTLLPCKLFSYVNAHIPTTLKRANKIYMPDSIVTLLLFIVTATSLASCTSGSSDTDRYIILLDSLIERHDDLERAKLIKLAELRQKKEHASSITDRYMANSLLFDEYETFNSDSAMKYVNLNLDIAARAGNTEWEIRSRLNKSGLLCGTGLLAQSKELMDSIDFPSIPKELLTEYYGQMIYLYSHLGNYTGGTINDFYIKERAYKDSIMKTIDSTHPDYLWYKGWDVLGTDKPKDEVIAALADKLGKSPLNSRQDAKDAYILAKLYEENGDRENYKKYTVLSGVSDVRSVNAEIASLEELSKIMFDEGDIDRAYSYINYCLNKAIIYPNRVRAYGISQTLDEVNQAYQERSQSQQKRTHIFLIIVGVLAIILTVMIITNIIQNLRLKRQGKNLDAANKSLNKNIAELSEAQRQLNKANDKLKELNNNLKQKNEELNEANYVKEEYIGYVFTICSSYIGKLEDLKRNIHLKAVTKKYREIEAETANIDMKDELKEFYKSFDTIFLHIYPNFVTDFNTLLQEDKRIIPREGELLNTELRIYALVRLGITDSVKIAEFLHCSSQTVYNNRFKVRNKAIISKKDFADSVRTLGKYMDRTS